MSELPSRPPHFRMRWYLLVLLLIALFTVLPVFTTVLGAVIANDHGCAVNEGNINPCVIDGVDQGQTLAFMGMSFLYLLLTFPLGILFFVVWLIVLLVHRSRWNKRQRLAA